MLQDFIDSCSSPQSHGTLEKIDMPSERALQVRVVDAGDGTGAGSCEGGDVAGRGGRINGSGVGWRPLYQPNQRWTREPMEDPKGAHCSHIGEPSVAAASERQ